MSKPKKPTIKLPKKITFFETCSNCGGIEETEHQATFANSNYRKLFVESEIANASDRYGGSFETVRREGEHKDLRSCIQHLQEQMRDISYRVGGLELNVRPLDY